MRAGTVLSMLWFRGSRSAPCVCCAETLCSVVPRERLGCGWACKHSAEVALQKRVQQYETILRGVIMVLLDGLQSALT
jgi:hypothetical protein